MKATWRTPVFILAITCLSAPIPALAAPFGATVLLQGFNPRAPDDLIVSVPYDQPTAVSDAILAGWGEVRNFVCGPFKARMAKPDLLAG